MFFASAALQFAEVHNAFNMIASKAGNDVFIGYPLHHI